MPCNWSPHKGHWVGELAAFAVFTPCAFVVPAGLIGEEQADDDDVNQLVPFARILRAAKNSKKKINKHEFVTIYKIPYDLMLD